MWELGGRARDVVQECVVVCEGQFLGEECEILGSTSEARLEALKEGEAVCSVRMVVL